MFKNSILAVALLLISIQASAVVLLTDDSVFGTNSVIRDVDNSREFLRMSETAGMNFNQVSAVLGTTYAGWQISTSAFLDDLLVSTGVADGSSNPADIATVDMMLDWFCPVAAGCRADTSVARRVRGSVLDTVLTSTGTVSQAAYDIGVRINTSPERVSWGQQGFSFTNANQGVWLTRAVSVSEPGSLLLLLMGLAGMVWRRRSLSSK